MCLINYMEMARWVYSGTSVSSRLQHAGNWMPRCCALPRAFITNKQRVKDVGMGL